MIFLNVNIHFGGGRNVHLLIFHPHIESQLSNCSEQLINYKLQTIHLI
jgi:hypothetical protein